ncbi:hypothetical protein HDK90DRAFT_471051 [Phyllosticta capitalensis]|uniref:Uncharacterized protein n=1 Tax=Phyllosticta capitalensis TaxID=121624 RepID=A0ABR1Y9G6_9PEZI
MDHHLHLNSIQTGAPADMPPATEPHTNRNSTRDTSLQTRSQGNLLKRKDSKLSMGMTTFPSLDDMRAIPKEALTVEKAAEKKGATLTFSDSYTYQNQNSAANSNGMLAVGNGEQYGREGGMSPRPPLQNSMGDDLSPKMLNHLAQGHEIQVLRDKENAEAKAKRVCQQKAIEHESFGSKKSLRKTLKHQVSTLFGKKSQTVSACKSSNSNSRANSLTYPMTPTTGAAHRRGLDLPRPPIFIDHNSARRNGFDLPRERVFGDYDVDRRHGLDLP